MTSALRIWLADVLAAGGASAVLASRGVQTTTPYGPALVTIIPLADAGVSASQAIRVSVQGAFMVLCDPISGSQIAAKQAAPGMIKAYLRRKHIRRVLGCIKQKVS